MKNCISEVYQAVWINVGLGGYVGVVLNRAKCQLKGLFWKCTAEKQDYSVE
jgi:hypothetical protein